MKQSITIPEAAAFLRERDDFLILTHRRPDGDTIGCAAALCGGLRALGKRAFILENPQFTPKFRPFLDGLTTPSVGEKACIVAVDIASSRLFPFGCETLTERTALAIDHHGRNDLYADRSYIDPSAAACGEIVLDILRELGVTPDRRIAEALYCAVSTDTGCFRYSNTTAKTLRAAAYCKDCGADTFAINQVMFLTKRMERLKLEAYLTESTEFFADGLVAISQLPSEKRRELGITEDDIDDISGFCREIAGVEIGVMIRDERGDGKLSVRTSPRYDASAICAALGGGGHSAAAGATVSGGIAAAREAVLRVLTEMGVL